MQAPHEPNEIAVKGLVEESDDEIAWAIYKRIEPRYSRTNRMLADITKVAMRGDEMDTFNMQDYEIVPTPQHDSPRKFLTYWTG